MCKMFHKISFLISFSLFTLLHAGCVKSHATTPEDELKQFAQATGAQWLTEIRHLQGNLDINKLRKLSPEALKLIRGISIVQTTIEKAPNLHFLPSLKWLRLSINKIHDISNLANLPILYLDLSENPLKEVSSVALIRNLELLSIGNTLVVNLPDLSKLTMLKTLDMFSTPLLSLAKIETIRSDFDMNIMGCTELTNIDPLLSARINTLFIDQETYNRFKPWFDAHLQDIKAKRPAFTIRFTMTK